MNTLLRIDVSPRITDSHSRDLANKVESKWKLAHTSMKTVLCDLANINIPHVNQEYIEATFVPKSDRTAQMNSVLSLADKFIADIRSADTVLISVPMYNFTVPSVFKAYIDYISRVGDTVLIDESGITGMLTGKKLVIAAAYGADFSQMKSMDFLEPYIKNMFGMLGFTDINYIAIENTSMLSKEALEEKKQTLADSI
ncbi:MAG: hypothetical protein COA92_09570 [Sulfurovum sp.]|nr:MAG: hypothetical protein COA92_09570 [Sulfurovum sp.]